jgi:hypothetical protein
MQKVKFNLNPGELDSSRLDGGEMFAGSEGAGRLRVSRPVHLG